MVLQTKNTSETIRIGKRIGTLLLPGDVIALVGELGTGKTQFIKGLAAGAEVGKTAYIASPSFTLINEYPGRAPFYHIDLYRLETEKEAEELGLEEYIQGRGIAAIEWADRIPSLLPKEILWIHIHYCGKHSRSIEILGKGKRYLKIVEDLKGSRIQGVK
jgi:tRNA threonylcarbamoyladenosine biosynthesis protein TsaE